MGIHWTALRNAVHFWYQGKITPTHSLHRNIQAMIITHGKVVSSCTVTKDPTLQYFTYWRAVEHSTDLEGSLHGLKSLLSLAQTAVIGLKCVSAELCEGRVLTCFFPKLNSRCKCSYKYFSNTYHIFFLEQLWQRPYICTFLQAHTSITFLSAVPNWDLQG